MERVAAEYPATFVVDYPDVERHRLMVFLRPIAALPILVILALVSGSALHTESDGPHTGAGAGLFAATALMLFVCQKYPRWWFDWSLQLTRFAARVGAYLALLRDEYPSTDEEQAVHLEIPYPDARRLNPVLPLIKWFLAIPHWIALAFLSSAAVVAVLIAWFAILFTGRYPVPLFEFVTGVFRWWVRAAAYALLLTTDRYPPFRLAV